MGAMKTLATDATLLAVSLSLCCGALNVEAPPAESAELVECIAEIVGNLPGAILKATVLTSGESSDLLSALLAAVKVPVVVNSVERRRAKGVETRGASDVVIALRGNVTAGRVLGESLWNVDTKFLLVRDSDGDAEECFRLFWARRVFNVFALVRGSRGLALRTFRPYQPGRCSDTSPVPLGEWSGGAFRGGGLAEIAADEGLANLNGCPLPVSAVEARPFIIFPEEGGSVGGIEGEYLGVLAEKLNFVPVFPYAGNGESWGHTDPPRGVLGEVYLGKSEIGIGGIGSNFGTHDDIDQSVPYNEDECITFYVPVGAGRTALPWLESIKSDLPPLQWGIILLAFVVVTVIFAVGSHSTPATAFVHTFSSLLGHSITVPDRASMRYLTISWIIFSGIIGDVYRASLGSLITVPLHPPEIETFEDLVDSGLTLYGHTDMLDAIKAREGEPVFEEITRRYVATNSNIDIDEDFSFGRDRRSAIIRCVSSFSYSALLDPGALAHLRPLTECVFAFPPVIVLRKNSPFTKTVNKVVTTLSESGIGNHWKSSFLYDIPESPQVYEPLNLGQSFGIFVILLAGHAFASVAFLAELGLGFAWCPNGARCRRK